ncbi:hypothetical protein FGM00_17675 [Aggregatimonas sangjinii]|uniref:DUF4249 family protein n=1 Tax=Aggregatimonas sangjinii TaxID=2583587 RepID=A0A5B7SYI9_9FLAO|nr:hypothetical protein [Aggregatimonas sangjinii]QCX01854.1 hypothetical protein FGM00_17675 [Aggregatimonas sangjinii]
MRRYVLYCSTLIVLMLSCSKDDSVKIPKSTEVSGKVIFEMNGTSLNTEDYGLKVTLGDTMIVALDSLGTFDFKDIVFSEYKFKIENDQEVFLDTVIAVDKTPFNLDFKVSSTALRDFFNYKEGDVLVYTYDALYTNGYAYTYQKIEGIKEWKILDITKENGFSIYTIEESLTANKTFFEDRFDDESAILTTEIDSTTIFKITGELEKENPKIMGDRFGETVNYGFGASNVILVYQFTYPHCSGTFCNENYWMIQRFSYTAEENHVFRPSSWIYHAPSRITVSTERGIEEIYDYSMGTSHSAPGSFEHLQLQELIRK